MELDYGGVHVGANGGTADNNSGQYNLRQQQRPFPTQATIVSLKNVHYNITASDLVEAVEHLNGTNPPFTNLPLPKLDFDASGRSTGGALWYIPNYSDAVRVAHLLNNEVLDGNAISASILSVDVPIGPGAVSSPFNANSSVAVAAGLNSVGAAFPGVHPAGRGNATDAKLHARGAAGGGVEKKKPVVSRLGPKTVLSRLGPKKEEILSRLGPKLKGEGILRRLGNKPKPNFKK
ncbi:hypothetical protein HDU82_005861 [Entophlyctis luteolus]|nr:hypothetical protein HDU82_005861 [Entophlyctis luteolus]